MKRQKLAPPYTLEARKLWAKPFVGTPVRHGVYVGRVIGHDDQSGTIDVQVGTALGRITLGREERYNPTHLTPTNFAGDGAALRVRVLESPDPARKTPVALALELGPQAAPRRHRSWYRRGARTDWQLRSIAGRARPSNQREASTRLDLQAHLLCLRARQRSRHASHHLHLSCRKSAAPATGSSSRSHRRCASVRYPVSTPRRCEERQSRRARSLPQSRRRATSWHSREHRA